MVVILFSLLIVSGHNAAFSQQEIYKWSDPANMGLSVASQDRFMPTQELNQSPHKVDIGATGNFNLTIPLMTVPGRNGLNYDIKLTYTPGIKVTQEASWVGLGWNLDVGSITRNVLGIEDSWIYPNNQDDWFRDIYSISCPAGSGKILQFPGAGVDTFQMEEWLPWKILYDTTNIITSQFVSCSCDYHSNLRDRRFLVTTEDGTTYVFSQGSGSAGLGAGATSNVAITANSPYLIFPINDPFTHWYLTSIVLPNYLYSHGGNDFEPSYVPTNDEGWIRIIWSYDGAQDSKKFYYTTHNTNPSDNPPREISLDEITYPEYIITPLYIAQFITEAEVVNSISQTLDDKWMNNYYCGFLNDYDFLCGSYVPWDYTVVDQNDQPNEVKRRLKCVKLYRNTLTSNTIPPDLGTPIREVDFAYMAPGSGIAGRTMLQSIQTTANGVSLPPYQFTYWDGPTGQTYSGLLFSSSGYYATAYRYPWDAQVGFQGWYNSNPMNSTDPYSWIKGNITDGKVFNLKEITYPTGGTIDFDYESNKYQVDFTYSGKSWAGGQWDGNTCGLGCRLKSQTINDKINSSPQVYSYSYSTSNVSGVGRVYADPVDFYDVKINGNRYYSSTDVPNDYLFNQTNHQVLYGSITETQPDGSTVVSTYSVAGLNDNIQNYSLSQVYSLRGELQERDFFDPSGIKLKTEQFTPYEAIKFTYGGTSPFLYGSIWKSEENESLTIYDQNGQNGVTKLVTSIFDQANGLISDRDEVNSDGVGRESHYTYPCDYTTNEILYLEMYSDLWTIAYMKQRNMISFPIETLVYDDLGYTTYYGEINRYYIPLEEGNKIFLRSKLEYSNPSPGMPSPWSASSDGSTFFYDASTYKAKETYSYNYLNDDLDSTTDANGNITSYLYGYDNSMVIAEMVNTRKGESGYIGLEDGWQDWEAGSSTIVNTQSHTGAYSAYCNNANAYGPTKNFYCSNGIDKTKSYMLDAWAKVVSGTGLIYIEVRDGSNNVINSVSHSFTTAGGTDWQHVRVTIMPQQMTGLPSNGYLRVFCGFPNSSSNSGYVDDVRFAPANAAMTTMTYDPSTLLETSVADANNNPTYFSYDALQRLTNVQNYNANTLTNYNYYTSSVPNFITTTQYRSATDLTTTKEYMDGLGRKIQAQTALGTDDIVSDQTYDQLGRVSTTYKPFQYTTGHSYDGNTGILSQATNYYNSNVYSGLSDSYPYTTYEYYSDGRFKDTKPSGSPWQTHYMQYSYGANGASDVAGYSANTLYKTTLTDENGIVKNEFRDYFGNLVQTIDNVISTVTDSTSQNLKTQFSYDLVGNLTETIPPNGHTTTYSYNTLSQLTQKTSPDAGTVQYLYDKNGNLRFIKDADHTGSAANNASWNSILIGTGSNQQNLTLSMPGNLVIYLWNYGSYSTDNITATIKTLGGTVLKTFSVLLSQGNGSSNIYLSKGTYQCVITTSDYYGEDEFDWNIYCNTGYEFVYKKYDTLNREIEEGEYISNSANGNFTQANADNVNFPTSNTLVWKKFYYDTLSVDANATGQTNIKGRLSYAESYRFGSLMIRTSYSYDNMGRVAWMVENGFSWYPKKLYYTYDLQGNVTQKESYDLDWRTYLFYTNYTYDQAGRLNTVQTVANGNSTTEASYQYFASGKPKQLTLGTPPAATVTYNYNERDWLSQINTSKFWEHLGYNASSEIGGTQQWNGNISWMTYYMYGVNYQDPWYVFLPTSTVGYSFSYDNANRLAGGTFGFYGDEGGGYPYWFSEGSYNMPLIHYDGSGNITALQRYGSGTTAIDNLSYSYSSGTNRVASITNSVNSTTSTYTYDFNGNVVSDSHSNIAFEIYDIDNHPVTVYKTNGDVIQYGYDANGNRMQKLVNSTYTFYINGKDGETETVNLEPYSQDVIYNILANGENIGQVKFSYPSTYSHYYYLKDHLGDVKMTLAANGSVDSYNDYYPFGLQMPGRNQTASADGRYKYIGVERDAETGLDVTGTRRYDSWNGRFNRTDNFDFFSPDVSPYSYSFNNPLLFTDASGDTAIPYFPPPTEYPPNSGIPLSGLEIIEPSLAGSSESSSGTIVAGGLVLGATFDVEPVTKIILGGAAAIYFGAKAYQLYQQSEKSKGQKVGTEVKSKDLTDKEGKIAAKLGKSVKEVREAIHKVKADKGIDNNADVDVDLNTGEVYPKSPDGGHGDSIGNIFDKLH